MNTMRVAVLSDIHANYAALKAVLADLEQREVEAVWCLGDIVGRGPDPLPAARVMWRLYNAQTPDHQFGWLSGNHEMLLFDRIPAGMVGGQTSMTISGDNQYAVETVLKHRKMFDQEWDNQEDVWNWLASLPPYQLPLYGHVYLAHAYYGFGEDGQVVVDDTFRTFLIEDGAINDMLRHLNQGAGVQNGLVMCGHTHISRAVVWDPETDRGVSVPNHHAPDGHWFDLTQQLVYLNPGSVGFPRQTPAHDDGCPTYLILTTEDSFATVHAQFVRVGYDFDSLKLDPDYPEIYRDELARTARGKYGCPQDE